MPKVAPGKQVEHGLREDVRGRVAQRVPTPVGRGHDDLDAVAVDQHPVEVSLDPVDHGDHCVATESRPDRLGETSGRRARGDLSGRAVGEHDVDEVSHKEREPTGDLRRPPGDCQPARASAGSRSAGSPSRTFATSVGSVSAVFVA